jgi:hypothetical protein
MSKQLDRYKELVRHLVELLTFANETLRDEGYEYTATEVDIRLDNLRRCYPKEEV